VLDDVAVLAKVATKKTAGVLGDDLALNAEQVTNMQPDRELPVVWAVAKGSFINKAILVPAALMISAATPWLVTPLLMLGGAFLCFEGFEKIVHKLLHKRETEERHADLVAAVSDPKVDMVEFEKTRIKGAIRTDFILSAEILVIALGTAAQASLLQKAILLAFIAVTFTIAVYGVVAGIVKLDDLGLALRDKASSAARALGGAILRAAPYMIRGLTIAGTAAMFLVGGGIVTHGVPVLHTVSHILENHAAATSGLLEWLVPTLFNAIVGIVLGGVLVLVVTMASRVVKRRTASVD
jgi:predicted DNA repair protein MutK